MKVGDKFKFEIPPNLAYELNLVGSPNPRLPESKSSLQRRSVFVGGIFGLGTVRAVGQVGRNLEFKFVADLHELQALGPAGMTWFKGKLIGSPRCTELSKTVPSSSVPW